MVIGLPQIVVATRGRLLTREESECVLSLIPPATYAPGCRSTGHAAQEIVAAFPHLIAGWDGKCSIELGDSLYEAAQQTIERLS
jgi:hypothetical protein